LGGHQGDLKEHFWSDDALVVVNSFGGYLFLHAQAQLPTYPGKVLLISPIVGDFQNEEIRMGFVPPRAEVLLHMAQSGRFPCPLHAEIHVGSEDWQSHPTNVSTFGKVVGIPGEVVPGGGHMLGKAYVETLLDSWLPTH
jgi:hypothetical protein